MKQLIEEQLSQFEKQKEVYMTNLRAYYHAQWNGTEEEKEVYRIEAEKSRNVLNEWYVASLKQFIDGLIAREEGEFQDEHPVDCIDGVTPVETYGYEATYNQAKKETISHLKELKEELN